MNSARAHRFVRIFIGAALVETVFGGVRRVHDALAFLDGERSFESVSGLVALLWLPVMAAMLWLAARQLGWFRKRQAWDEQSIAAAGATSHEWVWEAGPDLALSYTNDRVRALLGIPPEEALGRRLTDVVAPHEMARIEEIVRAGLEGSGWQDVEVEMQHADGLMVALQSSATCILDARGRVQGIRGACRPVPLSGTAYRARAAVRREVEELLARGAVMIALQPIVDLPTGRVTGAEALARFPDRQPEAMFDRADSVGLGRELELLAVRSALPLLADLPEGAYLSVNVSPDVLLGSPLPAVLAESGVPLNRLVLEITERVRVAGYDDLHAILQPLRAQGLRVAVDDTGAGYASFSHVLQLRPDIIKLDRSLVSAIDTDPAQRSLVTAVALFALELGASLTAEGVETVAQLQALAELGVDSGQGYLLGRPTLDRAHLSGPFPQSMAVGSPPLGLPILRHPVPGPSIHAR